MHDILLPSDRRTRLRNAVRFPDEAAFLARLPLAGRRVPLRSYWRRRAIHPQALGRELLLSSPVFGGVAEHFISGSDLPSGIEAATEAAALQAQEAARRAREIGRRVPALKRVPNALERVPDALARVPDALECVPIPHLTITRQAGNHDAYPAVRHRASERPQVSQIEVPKMEPKEVAKVEIDRKKSGRRTHRARHGVGRKAILGGIGVGALLMYYFDAASGRRRRALVRDQFVHLKNVVTRRVPDRIEQRGRFFRGVARGLRHDAAGVMMNGHQPSVDDETLVDRVRSEVLRRRGIKAGEIHLEAYRGVVTLRGQLQYPDEITRLIEDTSRTEGVLQVRSYLHLPGTLAPNKAEIYELEQGPRTAGGW